jgi:hypothetical protein
MEKAFEKTRRQQVYHLANQSCLRIFSRLTFGFSAVITIVAASASSMYPLPSPRQLSWQQQETEALIHFGLNTFTGEEWGSGQVDPKLFNASRFTPSQWVECSKMPVAVSCTELHGYAWS